MQTHSEFLQVSPLHAIRVQISGNPAGVPVIVLHGGPGAGINQREIQAFDPAFYRIITFDQRGAGESTPKGETFENTTADLISDINKICTHFKIEYPVLAGGSAGTTYALLYALQYPEKVKGLVLRATYLNRLEDMDWMYGPAGVRNLCPDHWNEFVSIIPPKQRDEVVAAYQKMLNHNDPAIQTLAASTWNEWPAPLPTAPTRTIFKDQKERDEALQFAKICNHHFVNNMFMQDNEILANISRIRHIPIEMAHGDSDMIVRLSGAQDLQKAHPLAVLTVAKGAAHSIEDPDLFIALKQATERMKTRRLNAPAMALASSVHPPSIT